MPHNMATILTLAALQEQKERLIAEGGTPTLPTTSGQYIFYFFLVTFLTQRYYNRVGSSHFLFI